MSADSMAENQSLSTPYILLMLMVIVCAMVAYMVLPWLIAVVLIWPKDWTEFLQMRVPTIEKAILWDGKLCVPQMRVNFSRPGMPSASVTVVDPVSKQTEELSAIIPFNQVNLVADNSTLWCVTNSSVFRMQNGEVTETTSPRALRSPESAFRYRGQLAVIENSRMIRHMRGMTSVFELLVWTGTAWQSEGELLLPRPVDVQSPASANVGQEATDASSGNAVATPGNAQADLSAWGGATQVSAIEVNGLTHWFCTDGNQILHSSGDPIIEPDTTSAQAPENAGFHVTGWYPVGSGRFTGFELGSDSQGVMLLEGTDRRFRTPFASSELKLLRWNEGRWAVAQKKESSGILGSRLVSDGTKAYIVSQAVANHLGMKEVGPAGGQDYRFTIEPKGASWDRLAQTVQKTAWWSPYIVVFVFAVSASWLMKVFRSSRYVFGHQTLELASINRRTLAKIVDWLIIATPNFILNWALFGAKSQQEIVEIMMPPDLGLQSQFARLGLIFLGLLVYGLFCLSALAIVEGRWGISPGKWLCGIRVIRTTLRPCGFFRAFLRELLMIADCFPVIGWFPSACCVAFTDFRQRLGDLVADTIVVRRPVLASARASELESAARDE